MAHENSSSARFASPYSSCSGGDQAGAVLLEGPRFAHVQESTNLPALWWSLFLGLPEDVLLMILVDVIVEEGKISRQERTRVQLVCRALRNFVNLIPRFWNQISTSEPPELWRQHLEKSGGMELAVTCDFPPGKGELHPSFLTMILPHAHRIRSFICTFDEDSIQLVVEVATRAAQTLRNLGIFCLDGSEVKGIPFDGMPRLEKLELLDIYPHDSMWLQATGLRVVKLTGMVWVPEVSAFLDFLEASVNLECFYYSLKENVFEQEALGPQTLPASHRDVIILPNLTHFTAYSIPASHVQVILQRVSFPPHSHFDATTADTFPPEENQFNFIVPVVNHLVALRPPSSLALEFNDEDAYIVAAEQRWRLGFYNDGLDINPRELSYRMLLQAIPSEIRAFIHSVLVVELKSQEDNAEWLVEALSDDKINITTFECPLDEGWMDALWVDESSGWAGFRLPALQSLTFNICIYTTVVSIITIKDLLQVRSAVMPHFGLHELDVVIRVPRTYEEGEIKVALDDPQLLNLGAQVERVPEDETDSAEAPQELDERCEAEDEDEDEDEDLDGDELTLEHRAE